ncbi:MAG: serine--tRNA ligase [Candidatus Onthomorpha sp.]|nr:serine--tRNA ligase [Bacteroidales bacterium]MDY5698619.1 serine--tRNA ligase [Candidatus Onthomorpha sp.]MCI6800291.1 serine--tRNA ligase [Bacteroidales bacterium]MCI7034754.1 serine--tRNA ligase [Bacteroidales bacterium]MCI7407548.1 serine--tRNA ligase [Bacteroidales bacterium]
MLQLGFIRENREYVIERLGVKHFKDAEQIIDNVISQDNKRRNTQTELDKVKAEANSIAKQVGMLYKQGQKEQAEEMKKQSATCKEKEKELSELLVQTESEIRSLLLTIPNLPNKDVPLGKTAEDNVVVLQKGEMPALSENAKPHWELCSEYDIIDFELGNKITGAGFPLYKKKGARLQRALINFFLDEAARDGFTEVQPPLMVNESSALATGQLPDKEAQMYTIPLDNFYMIPTAEVPVTNIFRDTIQKEKDLPLQYCAYSQCFRREAGSYGKDVRGLNRLHQFDKVEIVCIDTPEHSYEQLEVMKAHVASLLDKLELPYRILRLCGGDMSFTSAITYDFEVWSAAQKRWLEVSSVSNFETYQANRLKLRYKNSEGKTVLAHTLNGSALALPRIVAALLENNQTPEGIKIPKALQQYTGFEMID